MTTTTQTSTQTAVSTVAVPLHEIRRALEWVIPSASTDSSNPSFSVVNFIFGEPAQHTPHYDRDWIKVPAKSYALSVAATDRYRLSYATISGAQVTDTTDLTSIDAGGSFSVPVKELKAAMKAWPKPTSIGSTDVMVAFKVESSQVTVSVTDHGQLTTQAVLPTINDRPFPRYKDLIPDVPRGRSEAVFFTLNSSFVQQMGAAAAKVNDRSAGISFAPSHPNKAIPVRTHWDADSLSHFSAIIMPIREN